MNTTIAPPSDRTSGNQASAPSVARHQPWTGPVKPITDSVTKPST